MARFFCFVKDESGATAVEYALISSIIVSAIVAALTLIGPNLAAIFAAVAKAFP